MKTIIYNGNVILNDSIVKNSHLELENGKIVKIGKENSTKTITKGSFSEDVHYIDAKGNYISPGFIDLHVHGVGTCDLYEDTNSGLTNMVSLLASHGITGFLPTLITAPFDKIISAMGIISGCIANMDISGPVVLGINLEGPYINPEKHGAHPVAHIRKPNMEELQKILTAASGHLKIMTIAPEVPGNIDFAKELKKNGVIPAIGHTMASFDQTVKAIDQGISYISHAFNAMTPFHHRAPGAIGAIMMQKDVIVEIIVDGIHVHPAVVKFLFQVKDNKDIVLVTDKLTGISGPGETVLFAGCGTQSDGSSARSDSGKIMGSVVPINKALQNVIRYTGMTLTETIKLASINPARLLGINNKTGSLEIDKNADIVIFDNDFDVTTTLVKGKVVCQS